MKTCLTLLLILISSLLWSQTDSSTLSFVAYWKKGDTKKYKITKTKEKHQKDSLLQSEVESYIVSFNILDSTENSYLIEMKYEETLESDTELPAELEAVLQNNNIQSVRYLTDELGAFQEVVNWEELRDLMNLAFDKIIETTPVDKSVNLKKVMKPLQDVFQSRESIESLLLKELQYFHSPFGAEYNITEPVVYEDELPNLLGGEPFKAIGGLTFEKVDFEKQTCRFVNTLRIDPEDSKAFVAEYVANVMKGISFKSKKEKAKKLKEVEAAFADMSLDINDRNEYDYQYYPGWPILIKAKRSIYVQLEGSQLLKTEEIWIEALEK